VGERAVVVLLSEGELFGGDGDGLLRAARRERSDLAVLVGWGWRVEDFGLAAGAGGAGLEQRADDPSG